MKINWWFGSMSNKLILLLLMLIVVLYERFWTIRQNCRKCQLMIWSENRKDNKKNIQMDFHKTIDDRNHQQ